MSVIDLVKWNGNPSILAWKFPSEELSTWTQLIVNETQEAYVVKEGVYQGPFAAGRHTLSTENIPLIRTLIGLPFGGKSPFTAEVWYVNRATNLDVRWGTPDAIQLKDPKYEIMVPVRAFGQYGIRISDAKKFLLKLVGTLPGFDVATLSEYFKGVFTTKIKTGIANAIIKNGQSVLEISTQLEVLSDMLKESLAAEMDEYGVGLAQFNIHSINVPEDDSAVITLKAALARRTEMGLLGTNYQQQRSFDVLETAAGNEGTAGGVMGAGIGMGMGMGMGVPMGGAFAQLTPQMQATTAAPQSVCPKCNAQNSSGTRFCGNCGSNLATFSSGAQRTSITCDKCNTQVAKGARFCPNCADPINACPTCGEDNPANAIRCCKCGLAMPTDCSNCKTLITAGSKFCPECGMKTSRSCNKCEAELIAGAKFCSNCGEPQ
jgi:membrane protease subunit (stomatin/prohibitin family)